MTKKVLDKKLIFLILQKPNSSIKIYAALDFQQKTSGLYQILIEYVQLIFQFKSVIIMIRPRTVGHKTAHVLKLEAILIIAIANSL